MRILEDVGRIGQAVTGQRVFGEPYERNGITILPVAKFQGGGGGGGGEGPEGTGQGGGTGFGLAARPVGAYIIKDGSVSWQPAFDLNRAILGGQVVALAAFLTLRTAIKLRAKARAATAKSQAKAKASS